MPSILDLMGSIQQQGEQGRQRGLASLVGKAYAQPDQRQQILSTVAQRGAPDMAMQAQQGFSKMDETSAADLAREAGMFVALAQSGDEPTIQAAYQQLARKAQQAGHPVPLQYNPSFLPGIEKLASAGGSGDDLKSLRVGANGNYWAIRGGQFVDTGTPAAPNTYVRDQPGTPFDILDRRSGQSIYNQQPQPASQLAPNSTYQTPSGIVRINDVAPEDMAAVQADMISGGAQDNYALPPRDVSPQGRPPSRPDPSATITPYQQAQLGMQQQRLVAAQAAAARAGEAADSARALKEQAAADKQQKVQAAQADTVATYDDSIRKIDELLKSPEVRTLGTYTGDAMAILPHSGARDARASLDTIKNRILLDTISKLKALSATGASGFGSLSNQEGDILKNSIASLDKAQTHEAIVSALKDVQRVMRTSRDRVAGAGQATTAPQSGGWSIEVLP